jgi:hypothetical protein
MLSGPAMQAGRMGAIERSELLALLQTFLMLREDQSFRAVESSVSRSGRLTRPVIATLSAPVKRRRRSVIPAAGQIFVPAGAQVMSARRFSFWLI